MTKFYKEPRNHAKFFTDAANDVVAWNAIAMQRDPAKFEEFAKLFTHQRFELQIDLVFEELKEYRDGAVVNDHVEMLDAAADIFVTSAFLVYMFFGPDYLVELMKYPVGDHLPVDPYEALMRARDSFTTPEQMAYLAAHIFRMSRDSLVSNVYDGKGVLTEVLRSNNSKFPTEEVLRESHSMPDQPIEEVLTAELVWIEENRKGYSGFIAEKNEEFGVFVFRDDNGKIMKPKSFSEARITPFVEKA